MYSVHLYYFSISLFSESKELKKNSKRKASKDESSEISKKAFISSDPVPESAVFSVAENANEHNLLTEEQSFKQTSRSVDKKKTNSIHKNTEKIKNI